MTSMFLYRLNFFETVVRWWSSTFTHQHPECLIFVFPLRLYPLNVTLITHTQNVSSRLNKNSSLSITQNNTNLKFFSQTRQHDVSEFLKLYYFVSSVISLDLSLLVEMKTHSDVTNSDADTDAVRRWCVGDVSMVWVLSSDSLLLHCCLPPLQSQLLSAQQLTLRPFMGHSVPGLEKPPRLEL